MVTIMHVFCERTVFISVYGHLSFPPEHRVYTKMIELVFIALQRMTTLVHSELDVSVI